MASNRMRSYEQDMTDAEGNTSSKKVTYFEENKKINGGWNMTYKDPLYDFIEKLTKSEFKLYRFLEELILSRIGKETKVESAKLASGKSFIYHVKNDSENTVLHSPTKDAAAISKMLSLMIKNNIIMETSPKEYRFNPFIILPQFAKGDRLQKEWRVLQSDKKLFKRRGRNILDEYYDHKKSTKQSKLTFEDWVKNNKDIVIEPITVTGTSKKKIDSILELRMEEEIVNNHKPKDLEDSLPPIADLI